MATSRTGTATWKNIRKQALSQAQEQGQTLCPLCHTPLAWETHGQPNSPEADHIIPHSQGGPDRAWNTRIICRHCNLARNQKTKTRLNPQRLRKTNHDALW